MDGERGTRGTALRYERRLPRAWRAWNHRGSVGAEVFAKKLKPDQSRSKAGRSESRISTKVYVGNMSSTMWMRLRVV